MNWNHAVLGLNICLIGKNIPYNMSKIVKFSSIREPVMGSVILYQYYRGICLLCYVEAIKALE